MDGVRALELAVAVLGSGAITAFIAGFFARRKTIADARKAGADATQVLTGASIQQVKAWQDDVAELRAYRAEDKAAHDTEISEMRARLDAVETRADRAEARESALITWARQIVSLLRDRGIADYPTPPPGVSDSGGHSQIRPSRGQGQ